MRGINSTSATSRPRQGPHLPQGLGRSRQQLLRRPRSSHSIPRSRRTRLPGRSRRLRALSPHPRLHRLRALRRHRNRLSQLRRHRCRSHPDQRRHPSLRRRPTQVHRRKMSHGILRACAQSSTLVDWLERSRVGQKKRTRAAAIAIVESPIRGNTDCIPGMRTSPICFGERNIQAKAAKPKTSAVTRSAGCQRPSLSRSPAITRAAPGSGLPGRRKRT